MTDNIDDVINRILGMKRQVLDGSSNHCDVCENDWNWNNALDEVVHELRKAYNKEQKQK